MKKIIIILALFMCCAAFADEKVPPLNKVTMQLNAEQWVVSKTAKVIVNINAVLGKEGLATIHQHILDNLQQISDKGKWYITAFNRSQDRSGLEQIFAIAETRIADNVLANLRDQAKNVSKPGIKFEIANILFTPSLETLEQVRADLRSEIYKQANAELARLNKVYKQHYTLYNLSFIDERGATVRNVAMEAVAFNGSASGAVAPALNVSTKEQVNAMVVFASNRE